MADDRIIITNDRIYTIPEGVEGIPVEQAWPGATLSPFVKGAKLYPTPQGPVITHAEPLQGANDAIPEKPVVFPSREEQIRQRDAEFWARLERRYEKVTITAQPMRLFGQFKSDIEKPESAVDATRARLMRHFPDGPGMAAIAQQAATRYLKTLQKHLQKHRDEGGVWIPKPSQLAWRWHLFCREHGEAERAYDQAGYRPAMVNPYAIDFSDVKLTGRERKAAWKDRNRGRDDDRER